MNAFLTFLLSVVPYKVSSRDNLEVFTVSEERLQKDVRYLSQPERPRHYRNQKVLAETVSFIQIEFQKHAPRTDSQTFTVNGVEYRNVIASFGPEDAPRFIIGAHYDVAGEQPGADDNASGVAAILEIARLLSQHRTLRQRIDLVAFALEEPPFFAGPDMGSAHYARKLKAEKAKVKLMLALDMIGYFSEKKGSQDMPFPLKKIYPDTGNFIGIVGGLGHMGETRKLKNLFLEGAPELKVEILNAPASVPGVDLSDHRNFWDEGYPALMITDTAFYRNPNYHTSSDTYDTLDFRNMARVVQALYFSALNY